MRNIKKFFALFLVLVLSLTIFTACADQGSEPVKEGEKEVEEKEDDKVSEEDLPEIVISWGNDLHTAILYVPIEKAEEFKDYGVYLNPLSEDKFELIKDDKKLAILNFVPTKGGSELATLMGQGHIDAGLASNTAMLTAYDSGTDVKILAPVQTGGVSMVFGPDVDLDGWDDVSKHIEEREQPLKIGYHSPISGPRILIESILKENGFTVTEDPNEVDKDAILVDLKGSNNLLPSIGAGQVDAWVGPTAFPETAEYKDIGKIGMKIEQFPPEGKWNNFPCCVIGATEESINENEEAYAALMELVEKTCQFCMDERPEAAEILSKHIGIEPEIIEESTIVYTTEADEQWLDGIKVYVDALKNMNKFENRLDGKDFEEIVDEAIDLRFVK